VKKLLFLIICVIILFAINVFSHDNLQVHPTITYRALIKDIISNITDKYPELETYRGAKTVYQSGDAQYYNNIIEGSFGEDVPATRGRFHFYHYGNSGAGLFGCSSAYETAKDFWKWAFECYDYTTTGKERAYYSSGRAAHLLQDMLVPAHVQNDMHLPFTGPDDYEEYVRIPAVVGKIQGYGTSPKQESSLEGKENLQMEPTL